MKVYRPFPHQTPVQFISLGVMLFLTLACLSGPAPQTLAAPTPIEVTQASASSASATESVSATLPGAVAPSPSAALATETQSAPTQAAPQAITVQGYEIGTPTLTELYVSPTGSDNNSGSSPDQPLQSLSEAWNRVPVQLETSGYRINLLPGVYPCEPLPENPDNCINYFDNRHGTYAHPLILRAQSGRGSVTVRGGMNLRDVDYLYVLDITFAGGGSLPTNISGNNLFHLEDGNHVLLRGLNLDGPDCPSEECNNLQEVLKVNQAQYLYVEDSQIGGAWHTAVDYFVVQYGHFIRNNLHTAGQWCIYIKGGTAYLQIEGNELHDCQLGFQAGQSANLAVMRSPWLHYEAYDIKFVNNLLHDIPGVGLSAAGAYNTLFAYNTLYKVGTDTQNGYPLAQFVHGERNCTPIDEIPNVMQNCVTYTDAGGWGPARQTDSTPAIPNQHVYVLNNLFYNPTGTGTLYSHFSFAGPLERPAGFRNTPNPARADDNLVLRGNIIWNGPAGHPLGNEEAGNGCQTDNLTCNLEQLQRDNLINQIEPQLVDPQHGDYHPVQGGNLFSLGTYSSFQPAASFPTWATFTPAVPAGTLDNPVPADREGQERGANVVPGAYAGSATPSPARVYLPLLVNGRTMMIRLAQSP